MRHILAILALAAAAPLHAQEVAPMRGSFQPVNDVAPLISGEVSVTPEGEFLVIRLRAEGVPPGMRLAHIHGVPTRNPAEARCPGPEADANGDGLVDLMETRPAAGTTMIPFIDRPRTLEIASDAYPVAGADGRISYEARVETQALREAVDRRFGTPLALDRRVVFIHGAPEGAGLPESVASLEGVPARVTLPIACAELSPG